MKSIKLPTQWSNGVWHNIFKADNSKTFKINDNCLLDDFCYYCGYTIEDQINDSNLIISGPINLVGTNLNIRLSIINKNNVFEATYQVVKIPFVSLVVTFREDNGSLIVEDKLQDESLIKRVLYQPIADRFVSDGAEAITSFINDVK
jgi:hypothetical protein